MLPVSKFAKWTSRIPGMRLLNSGRVARLLEKADRARDAAQWRLASAAYAEALRLNPALPHVWVQYGHVAKEAGDLVGGEKAYRRAMSQGLDDADIHLQLGHILKLQGRLVEAQGCYAEALRRDPQQADVMLELSSLGWTRADFREALRAQGAVEAKRAAGQQSRATIAFDVTDVLAYTATSRRPTGIQRVQLEIVGALLDAERPDIDMMLLCYSRTSNYWIEIAPGLFRDVIAVMARDGDSASSDWQQLRSRITVHCLIGDDADIPIGARIANIGSSWAFGNYFLAVRRAKATRNVTFIPFVHDCIPILDPDAFVPELQRDFREWIAAILTHGDGFLTNSQSTASDFRKIAAGLGHPDITIAPVPLDAGFSTRVALGAPDPAGQLLQRFGLRDGRFVLFVATLEPRKNHLLAFEAWDGLLRTRNEDTVPDLVCVGGRGWRNAAILARLEKNPALKRKVCILHGLSDSELNQLYGACRFTIYPSRYEGWGLPVTESLSHGKVPLIARSSSLPEAGGEFADYFDLGDPDGFAAKLERMLDDDVYLQTREQVIRARFRPRDWLQIADDVVTQCLAMSSCPRPALAMPALPAATFIRLAKDRPGARPSGVVSGEIYRNGAGWCEPDERGCWIAQEGVAELIFAMPLSLRSDAEGVRVYLLIYGGAGLSVERGDDARDHTLTVHADGDALASFSVAESEQRWVMLRVAPSDTGILRLKFWVQSQQGNARRGQAVGVRGVFVCGASDAEARLRFVEGAALGGIDEPLHDTPLSCGGVTARLARAEPA